MKAIFINSIVLVVALSSFSNCGPYERHLTNRDHKCYMKKHRVKHAIESKIIDQVSTMPEIQTSSGVSQELFIQFIGDNHSLLNCTYKNIHLSCSKYLLKNKKIFFKQLFNRISIFKSKHRSLKCNESFDITTLGNYSFNAYGLESSNEDSFESLISPNIIKYKLFPFKQMNTSHNEWLIYDYVVPIYGFDFKLTVENGTLVSSSKYNLAGISCFNNLVVLLNEARLFNQMKIEALLTAKDIINTFNIFD